MKEFIKALRKGKGVDWISWNGYSLSKDDLCNIIKEYDYEIHNNPRKEQDMYNNIADCLEDIYDYE